MLVLWPAEASIPGLGPRAGWLLTRAAEMLGVSASTLRNWDRSGKLKAARNPMNGYRLYRHEDIARLLARIQNGIAGPASGQSRRKGGK